MGALITIVILGTVYSLAFIPLRAAQRSEAKKRAAVVGFACSLVVLVAAGGMFYAAFGAGFGDPMFPVSIALVFAGLCSIWAFRIFSGAARDLSGDHWDEPPVE